MVTQAVPTVDEAADFADYAEERLEPVTFAYQPAVHERPWGPNKKPFEVVINQGDPAARNDYGQKRVKVVNWRVTTADPEAIAALTSHKRFKVVTDAETEVTTTLADLKAREERIKELEEENARLRELRSLIGDPAAAEVLPVSDGFADGSGEVDQEGPSYESIPTPYPQPLPVVSRQTEPARLMKYGPKGKRIQLEPCPVHGCTRRDPGNYLNKGGMRNHSQQIVKHGKDPEMTAAHQAWLEANPLRHG